MNVGEKLYFKEGNLPVNFERKFRSSTVGKDCSKLLRARTKFNEIVDIFPIKLSKGTFENMLTRTSSWYLVANPEFELSGRGQSLLALPPFLPSAIF